MTRVYDHEQVPSTAITKEELGYVLSQIHPSLFILWLPPWNRLGTSLCLCWIPVLYPVPKYISSCFGWVTVKPSVITAVSVSQPAVLIFLDPLLSPTVQNSLIRHHHASATAHPGQKYIEMFFQIKILWATKPTARKKRRKKPKHDWQPST